MGLSCTKTNTIEWQPNEPVSNWLQLVATSITGRAEQQNFLVERIELLLSSVAIWLSDCPYPE